MPPFIPSDAVQDFQRFPVHHFTQSSLLSKFIFIMSKSDRKLRSSTRKNYSKMVASVDSDTEDDAREPGFIGSKSGGNKNINKNGGEIINNEFFLSCDDGDSSDPDSNVIETSDDDLKVARDELLRMKQKQKDVAKKNKLEKIVRETNAIRKSLNKTSGSGKKKSTARRSSNVTVASLRKMDDVVSEVDRLMEKTNLKLKCVESSSESGSEYASEIEEKPKKGSAVEEDREKPRRKGRRSGKNKSITSDVKFPQEWPHSHLSLHFVNRKKAYEELSLGEFCAGYSAILEFTRGSERDHRISHLKELMYLSTKFTWRSVLNYHGACLMEIERGHLSWGDSFLILQSTTLAGSTLNAHNGNSGNRTGGPPGQPKGEGTIFCKNYQRGTCQQSRDHFGLFYGENRLLKHICAKCWLKDRKCESHPETSDDCPHKG